MATNVSYNGTTYSVPAEGDDGWGSSLSSYLIALATGSLTKAGGSFSLTADANFGTSFGLKAQYIKSQATNPSSAGVIRLGNNESVGFRNAANSADLLLKANASDVLEFNGVAVLMPGLANIVNADISASAAIAYSKLNLSLSIVNADINAAAAIAYSKLASLTASRVLVSDVSGVVSVSSITSTTLGYLDATSSIQTQINTKVTASAAAITSALTMDEVAAPSTPASGKFAIYPKSDGKLYTLNDAGTETEVGAGGSSGINYIDNPNAETDASGYVAYADAAGSSPVDGTGGSPNITITRSTSSPLRGVASFLITKDAVNRQGQGVSYDFTIDVADKGKVLQGYFDYAISSGTYADDDMSVWIYDVTNSRLIQPAPYLLKNHSLPSERMPFEYQASIDSTSYRLIIHQASTSASAYTIKFDNVIVGPQAKLYGSAVTDWIDFTPTGSLSTNVTYTGKKRQVGSDIEYRIRLLFSGTNTQGACTINIPDTIDTTRIPGTVTGATLFGIGSVRDLASADFDVVVGYNSTTSVTVLLKNSSATYGYYAQVATNTNIPMTVASGDVIEVSFTVPVLGKSSSQIMSQDASTRVVDFLATGPNALTTTGATIVWATTTKDSVGGYNASTGEYTIKTPGDYEFSAGARCASTAMTVGHGTLLILYKNGSIYKYIASVRTQTTSAIARELISAPILASDCIAGDVFKINLVSDTSVALDHAIGNSFFWFSGKMIQGPAQIAASDSVVASYRISADKTPSVSNPIDFDNKIFDSHNAVTTGSSWRFTAPMSGTYQVANTNATSTTGGTLDLYVNGSQDRGLMSMTDISVRSSSANVKLLDGGYVDIRCDAAAKTFSGTKNNTIYITRIGNY